MQLSAIKGFFDELWNKIKKPFLVLLAIYTIAFSAIIRANYYYIDDLTRAASGMKGWDYFSRYLSVWLSNIIHADTYLTDVSPLPQLIAIVFLSLSGALLLYVFCKDNTGKFLCIFSTIALGLCPYFLECISYKYDSPYMAISIFGMIAPLVFYEDNKRGLILYALTAFLGTLTMCMTYQASSGMFPLFIAALAAKKWNENENVKAIIRFIIVSACSYIFGLLVFRVFILTPVDSYVTTYQAPFGSIISTTINNLKTYFSVIIRDFKPIWLYLIAFLCIGFVISFVLSSKRNKIVALLIALIVLSITAVLSFGVYALLAGSYFNPRAMYGFGAFITIILLSVASTEKMYLSKTAELALCWMFFVFSFTYGNCLNVQAKYTDFRVSEIITDLNSLEEFNSDEVKTVYFKGSIGYSPIIERIPNGNSTILKNLIPEPFCGDVTLSRTGFYLYYGIKNIEYYSPGEYSGDELPLLKETMYHDILGDGKNFLVVIK